MIRPAYTPLGMSGDDESPLGAFIRSQRELQAMSVRRLAELSGISNPYLSQIERGLREPSEQVLDAIAQQLELSADALKQHGGRGAEDDDDTEPPVVTAINEDTALTGRQRRALLEVYHSFTGRDPRRR
jgi:transcriptional regulator with XRE-family HTH domain